MPAISNEHFNNKAIRPAMPITAIEAWIDETNQLCRAPLLPAFKYRDHADADQCAQQAARPLACWAQKPAHPCFDA
jgi:hypothetical protein